MSGPAVSQSSAEEHKECKASWEGGKSSFQSTFWVTGHFQEAEKWVPWVWHEHGPCEKWLGSTWSTKETWEFVSRCVIRFKKYGGFHCLDCTVDLVSVFEGFRAIHDFRRRVCCHLIIHYDSRKICTNKSEPAGHLNLLPVKKYLQPFPGWQGAQGRGKGSTGWAGAGLCLQGWDPALS